MLLQRDLQDDILGERKMEYKDFAALLERTPDQSQEQVIRSLKNTIVSAGAGSGKTQTLASRFAYLIVADLKDSKGNSVANPSVDRILTLTFTKKAAAEMYQRIYKTLKGFCEKSKDERAKEKAKAALDNFSKARIQTLDSYSAGVLRQAAVLYGISPDFTAGADSSKIRELAFDFVLKNRNNPVIQWISEPAKIKECADLFADAVTKRTSLAASMNKEKKCRVFADSLKKQKEKIQEMWGDNAAPLLAVEECVARIKDNFPSDRPGAKNKAVWFDAIKEALAVWDSPKCQAALKSVKSLGGQEDLSSGSIQTIQNALANFNYSKKIYDDTESDLIQNVLFGMDKKSPGLANKLSGILTFLDDSKYLEGLHPLLDRFADEANDIKRKSGELTFKDINDMALLALRQNQDLRKQERDAYDFIMIDEFQDNNADNRDLLLEISRDDSGRVMENRLFFVGDEKQSIYKFRGADVSVFNSLKDYIQPCDQLSMSRNYRSNNLLLDAFNQIFGGFLPSDKDEPSVKDAFAKVFGQTTQEAYQAKFDKDARALFPEVKPKLDENLGKRIQVCLFDAKGLDEDAELKAQESKALFIAQKIQALHAKKEIPYKKFALLVKGRTHYSAIERIFALQKIPFALDMQGNIFFHATANDFYNVLRVAVYPADINAFAAFLSSPFAGMNLSDVEKVLSLLPQKAFDPKISADGILDQEAFQKYQEAKNFCEEFSKAALSSPIADSIERLWNGEGYKFYEEAEEGHYDLLYELARRADIDGKDLSWFVDQLAKEKDDAMAFLKSDASELDIKETECPVESPDAVNIMTIHKSKGLEFDYVFVWGLAESRAGRQNDNSKVFWTDDYGAVVANQSKSDNLFSLLAKNEEEKKNDAEARRLLYVALTRAAEGLWIIGDRPSDPKIEGKKPAADVIFSYDNEGASLPPSPFEKEEIPHYLLGSERPAKSQGQKSLQEKIQAYAAAQTIPANEAKNIWASPSELEDKGCGKGKDNVPPLAQEASLAYPEINSYVNASAMPKNDYGTLFHAFMENWAHDWKNWTAQNVAAGEYFKWEPKTQKISLENQKILLDTFFKILDKFIGIPGNPALEALAAGRDFKAEYKFKTKIKSFVIKGTMDAAFQNSDGTWTVLDYKTDLIENPQIYYNQLGCYKKTAADLFAGGDQSKIRCLLFYAESGRFADISQEAQKALESLTDEKIRNLIEKQEIL